MKAIQSKINLTWVVIIYAILSFSITRCLAQSNSPFTSPKGTDPKSINVPHKITLPAVPNPDPLPPRYIPPRGIPSNSGGFSSVTSSGNNNRTGRMSDGDEENLNNQTGEGMFDQIISEYSLFQHRNVHR